MESNYYVPDFEEFHKGFEYQQIEMCSINGGPRQLQYNTKVCTGHEGHYLDVGIEHGKIRCKYLDKTDIEDLGWEEEPVCIYNDDECNLTDGFVYSTSNPKIEYNLHLIENYKWVIYKQTIYNDLTGNSTQEDIFVGIIKNKSELRKLMKQLNTTKE